MTQTTFPSGEDPGSYHARRPRGVRPEAYRLDRHYLATQAAFQVLEAGGNAVDAGVAAGLALGVVHSDQVNVAGVAPMIIGCRARELVTIDGLGTWPRSASIALFQREHGGEIPEGLLRTVVPGGPAAWIEALRRYGTMSFGDVASFASRFARDGFFMYPFLHDQLRRVEHKTTRNPSNRRHLPARRPHARDWRIVRAGGSGPQPAIHDRRGTRRPRPQAAIARRGCRRCGMRSTAAT